MQKLIAIVGPTGTGKSTLALHLGQVFNGQIINADSRQIYRHMDIGTAKPDEMTRRLVRHHLYDILEPVERFSLAEYQDTAFKTINNVIAGDNQPFLVGGSGQYVWAVLEGWLIPRVAPDAVLRKQLEDQSESTGSAVLFNRLSELDPSAAKKIGSTNTRRIIRALEVIQTTGQPISELQKKQKPPYDTLIIGLTADRDELYNRLDRRVHDMIDRGFVNEVKSLLESGVDITYPSMSSIGYRQICDYLNNDMDLDSAIEKIKFETHRYVRQQYNWFRLNDARIRWLESNSNLKSAAMLIVEEFINGKGKIDEIHQDAGCRQRFCCN